MPAAITITIKTASNDKRIVLTVFLALVWGFFSLMTLTSLTVVFFTDIIKIIRDIYESFFLSGDRELCLSGFL